MTRFLSIISLLVLASPAAADYRAFLLSVQPNTAFNPSALPYFVVTNLDSKQYTFLHGGPEVIQVIAMESWVCSGHTGHRKRMCPDSQGRQFPPEAFKGDAFGLVHPGR